MYHMNASHIFEGAFEDHLISLVSGDIDTMGPTKNPIAW